MKKLLLIVLAFTIISISLTGILILVKNNSNNSIWKNSEKTIDLYGTFDENDITFEKLSKTVNSGENIQIPQIKGLKDKQIENKINQDIEKRIDKKLKEIKDNGGQKITDKYNDNEKCYRGFSNVWSYKYTIIYYLEDKKEEEKIYFNYELVNGEKLNFEDLFTTNADIISIIRRAFYRTMSENSTEDIGNIYFDKEKNIWMIQLNKYDYEIEDNVNVYEEYTPSINEYDINKKINNFINSEKQEFYFTPSRLYIGNDYDCIEFKDIANEVVIYDKYLTDENLYENNNIGNKKLWTCATVGIYQYDNTYQEYGFAEDNLFYEIRMLPDYDADSYYPFKDAIEKINEKAIEPIKSKLEEYKKIAKENKDKFYLLLLENSINYSTSEDIHYLISVNINEFIFPPVNISEKEGMIDKIIECYRYYNLAFYNNSGLMYAIESGNDIFDNQNITYDKIERKEDTKVYDARNLKEINSLDEVFVDSYDYMSMLKNKLSFIIKSKEKNISQEELNNFVDNAEFYFDAYYIKANVQGFDNMIYLKNWEDIDKSVLKIYDLDVE